MNPSWNEKLSEEELEERMLRGRARLSVLQRVLTHTYGRLSVSEIARQLGCSRRKVIWLQHVLELRTARGTEETGLGHYPLLQDVADDA